MRMFRAAAFLIASCLVPLCVSADPINTLAINPAHSDAHFFITHIFVEHVDGLVPILSGSVMLANHSEIPVHVDAVLDPNRVKTDEPDRDQALKGPEYFDTAAYPTWAFHSTTITSTGAKTFDMAGNFTLHGVTQPIHLKVNITGSPDHPAYTAVGSIDRRMFGMKGGRLDPVIGTNAEITLHVVLNDQP